MTECMSCHRAQATRFFKGIKTVIVSGRRGFPTQEDRSAFYALCEPCKQGEECTDAREVARMRLTEAQEIDEDTYVVAQVLSA